MEWIILNFKESSSKVLIFNICLAIYVNRVIYMYVYKLGVDCSGEKYTVKLLNSAVIKLWNVSDPCKCDVLS